MFSFQQFQVGDIVFLRADPSRSGSIIKILPEIKGKNRYEIYHSPTDIRQYFEDQIAAVKQGEQRSSEAKRLSPLEFRVRLNALRLKNPLSDSIYALHAARIRFIPFQFKPILKLVRLNSPDC